MHIPVLVEEIVNNVNIVDSPRVVDGTVGGGGYLRAILNSNQQAKVLGIDLDQISLDKVKKELDQSDLAQRAKLMKGNYSDIKNIVRKFNFTPLTAIVLDLGFSSLQLDDSSRGFSFQKSGPLDMRYDLSQKLKARDVVNTYSPQKLEETIKSFGEEKFSRSIAKSIVKTRRVERIETTDQLLGVIKDSLPPKVRHKAEDSARRVFQAIRIEVNHELDNLEKFLAESLDVLEKKGRILIISFHSLEDRIVKEFFKASARGCVCPPEFPKCICGHKPSIKIITKKPITPDKSEIEKNSRSRSAKLRIAEKI